MPNCWDVPDPWCSEDRFSIFWARRKTSLLHKRRLAGWRISSMLWRTLAAAESSWRQSDLVSLTCLYNAGTVCDLLSEYLCQGRRILELLKSFILYISIKDHCREVCESFLSFTSKSHPEFFDKLLTRFFLSSQTTCWIHLLLASFLELWSLDLLVIL